MIILGSVGMVHSAIDLGRRWGISDIVVGTLVLASLTSLPNLLTAVRLALPVAGVPGHVPAQRLSGDVAAVLVHHLLVHQRG